MIFQKLNPYTMKPEILTEINFRENGEVEIYDSKTATYIMTTEQELDEFLCDVEKPERMSEREKDESRTFSAAVAHNDWARAHQIVKEFYEYHYEKRKPCYESAWEELNELQKIERINLEVAERNSELYKTQRQAS